MLLLMCYDFSNPKPPMKTLLNKIPAQFSALLAAAAVCATLATASAQQTYTWDNGTGSHLWGNATNWVDDPALTFNNQTAIIYDSSFLVNTNNASSINGNRTINSLTIKSNYTTLNNGSLDIRTLLSFSATNRTLTFAANTGNASITVEQSTSGIVQIRLSGNDAAPAFWLRRNRERRAVGVHRLERGLPKVVEAHGRRHAVESGPQSGQCPAARGFSTRVITWPG
jgi:hypothetical protein